MTERRSLSADDWIKAGFRALAAEGAQALRVERLARSLKVSKGSFYWHFADVPALQQAMLAHWQEAATEAIIATLERDAVDPAQRLRELADAATSDLSDPYGGFSVEAAIRDWARHNPAVAEAQHVVDARRLAYLETLFVRNGLRGNKLTQAVRLFYAVYVGAQHLNANRAATREDLYAVIETTLRD
jgi:AcrR family transcriptional regulator